MNPNKEPNKGTSIVFRIAAPMTCSSAPWGATLEDGALATYFRKYNV